MTNTYIPFNTFTISFGKVLNTVQSMFLKNNPNFEKKIMHFMVNKNSGLIELFTIKIRFTRDLCKLVGKKVVLKLLFCFD